MAVSGKRAMKQFSSSTASMGSDEDHTIYCQPCDYDGPRIPADGYCRDCREHLCESCVKAHKKHTLSRHHILIDKASMPKTLQTSPANHRQSDSPTKPDIKHEGDVCVRTSKDEESTWITGIALVTPNLLVITDCSSVKLVDTRSKTVTNQLLIDTENYAWDVTTVNSTNVAVTVPNKQAIQFISVTTNKLGKKQILKVDGDCHGIHYYQDKLVVSFTEPAKVEILDMNGTILTTVRGENIFKWPSYVASDANSICVSDSEMGTVTKLNWQGKVIGSYGGMDGPRGIALSDDGTVFVCELEKNVIQEISWNRSKGKSILKDPDGPQAVCWCPETKTLYHSSYSGDFLHIFKLIY